MVKIFSFFKKLKRHFQCLVIPSVCIGYWVWDFSIIRTPDRFDSYINRGFNTFFKEIDLGEKKTKQNPTIILHTPIKRKSDTQHFCFRRIIMSENGRREHQGWNWGFFLFHRSLGSISWCQVCLHALLVTACPAVPALEVRQIETSESSLSRKDDQKGHSSGRTLLYRHFLWMPSLGTWGRATLIEAKFLVLLYLLTLLILAFGICFSEGLRCPENFFD